jgi:hypothetical protein
MSSTRRMFVVSGGILGLLSLFQLAQTMSVRGDAWQTLAPEEIADRAQVLVRGQPLEKAVAAGEIQVLADGASTAIKPADVLVRFNSSDTERARHAPVAVAFGISLGASLTLLLLGAAGLVAPRAGNEAAEASASLQEPP